MYQLPRSCLRDHQRTLGLRVERWFGVRLGIPHRYTDQMCADQERSLPALMNTEIGWADDDNGDLERYGAEANGC